MCKSRLLDLFLLEESEEGYSEVNALLQDKMLDSLAAFAGRIGAYALIYRLESIRGP